MTRLFVALVLAFCLVTPAPVAAKAAAPNAEQQLAQRRLEQLVREVKPHTGSVPLPQAAATLDLGNEYYFLDAADTRRVLIEAWGNPPSSVDGVLGMVLPTGKTFLDETWGAVVTYVNDGYVSDNDAKDIDYQALLEELREGEDADNDARQRAGFSTVHLVGWAQKPSYNATNHTLIWAKELAFGDEASRTLNYDVRVLGRRGVLSLNIVDSMENLDSVGASAEKLRSTATFNPGSRYTDYQPGVDQKAAYGIAGLVAGGAAVAVAKKAGLIGILLLILKKGGVFLFAGIAAAFTWIKKRFTGKAGGEFGSKHSEPAAEATPASEESSNF